MGKFLKKLKRANGAVTIEATISLTAFLFLFLMIYSVITICRAQAIIQVAINSAAKEISQYSYLYSLTGINEAMAEVTQGAEGTKQDVNDIAANVSQVFNGIQSISGKAAEITSDPYGVMENPQGAMDTWESMMGDLKEAGAAATEARKTLSEMASGDTKQLVFGMAKLMVSEGYEEAKSLVAEAVSRGLVQKHLKRSKDDTAESFCKAVGIQPGTYFGTESYFNGIDFSHSRLMPYGSSEITIVANYKIKLLQLLPIDLEFHCTQTAVTTAWMQGDVDIPDTPQAVVQQRGEAIWNSSSGSERERLIRSMGLKELKDEGFYSVSGSNYIHAYNPNDPQTFAVVRSFNPLTESDSVDAVNMADIIDRLEKISSQVESSMDNIHSVKIKKPDKDGNLKTSEVNCDGAKKMKVILVIPEDPGLKEKFEEALKTVDTEVEFEFLPGYGSVFEQKKTDDVGGGA